MQSIEEWLNRPDGLASRLRAIRRNAGLTGSRMADELGWRQSKVSKIETGKQLPTDDDIAGWVRVCGADAHFSRELMEQLAEARALHREWKQQVRLGHVAIQRNYEDLARGATVIRNAEVALIPGLLQTADYARYRIAESVTMHHASSDDIDTAIAQRMRRQQILYDTSKRFEFVITEAALRLLLCPRATMLVQLDRLLTLIGMPHIQLGIIPFGVELPTAPQNGFILFDDKLAVVETFVAETMHHADEAAAYAAAMDNLVAEAWNEEQARELIQQAIRALHAKQQH